MGSLFIVPYKLFQKPDSGALTQIYLAAHPDITINDIRGQHFVPLALHKESTPITMDAASQKELWDYSMSKLARYS